MTKNLILAASLMGLALGGCVQVESTTVLNGDGSGTVDVVYAMSLEVEQAMQEIADLDSGMEEDMGSAPLFDESFDMEDLKKELAEHDVKVKRYENGVENDKRVVRMTFAFDDVHGLQAAMELSGGGDNVIGVRELDDGNFILTTVPSAYAEEEEYEEPEDPMAGFDPENMGAAMADAARSVELMGVLMSHADDMSIVTAVTFPGEVLRHNATRVDGRTCYWVMDSGSMMSQQGMSEPEVVFAGAGLKLKAPKR